MQIGDLSRVIARTPELALGHLAHSLGGAGDLVPGVASQAASFTDFSLGEMTHLACGVLETVLRIPGPATDTLAGTLGVVAHVVARACQAIARFVQRAAVRTLRVAPAAVVARCIVTLPAV